jgi:hypothetical protein
VAQIQLQHGAVLLQLPLLTGTGGGVYVVECVCGNVVLVHFPTIVVCHGPGTHLAGLYNRRWLPLAVTILCQALLEEGSHVLGSECRCSVLTKRVELSPAF